MFARENSRFFMTDPSSISEWILHFRTSGDEVAALRLWDRIHPRVRELARRWIARMGIPVAFDEDDVTISVFATLCDRLRSGQLPNLNDRDGLWRLLVLMTARKANDHAKNSRAQKRSNGQNNPDVALQAISELRDTQLEPSIEVMMEDQCQSMLKALGDPALETVVLLKLEGYSNVEIAEKMNYSRRTIQRMLELVKDIWGQYDRE
jgi:DNA-directed RNA polymerase specialized sigma24 family protein